MQGQGSGALGRERPAFSEHDPEGETVGSISNERTFREDVSDPATIESVLCGLCERVCWRARKRRIKARTVTLKLRYADFHTLTRSRTLAPTSSELELYPILKEMLAAARTRPLPVRLLGVQLSNLGVFEQLSAVRPPRKSRRGRRPDPRALRLLDGRPGHAAGRRRQEAGGPPLRRPRRLNARAGAFDAVNRRAAGDRRW